MGPRKEKPKTKKKQTLRVRITDLAALKTGDRIALVPNPGSGNEFKGEATVVGGLGSYSEEPDRVFIRTDIATDESWNENTHSFFDVPPGHLLGVSAGYRKGELFLIKAVAVKPKSKPELKPQITAPKSKKTLSVRIRRGETLELPRRKRPHRLTPPVDPNFYLDYDIADQLKALAVAVLKNRPVLVIGETGAGKTSLIRYLAAKANAPYRRLNLNGQTNADDLIGKWIIKDGGMIWVDGILTEALLEGYWIVLDELNAALPEVLFTLQSLLDDDRFVTIPEKDGSIIRPHPDFRVFATMNPPETGNYAGTNELNRALLSRFPVVVNYSYLGPRAETQLLKRYTDKEEVVGKLIGLAKLARNAYAEGSLTMPLSTRDLIAATTLLADFTAAEAVRIAILNKAQNDNERSVLTDMLKTTGLLL